MSLTTCPFRLVCARMEDGDAPAIITREYDDDSVDLIVLEPSRWLDGDEPGHRRAARTYSVLRVPQGCMEGTEPRPSWYPIEAHPLKERR